MKTKFFLAIYLFFLANPFFGACTREGQAPKDALVTIITSPPLTLDPLFATTANAQHVNQIVQAGLTKIGEELTPVPNLAKSYKVINDTAIEFVLKKGCLFHNGREIKVEDVEKSMALYANPEQKSPFMTSFQKIVRFEKRGPQTFRLHTKKVEPDLLTDLSLMKILPVEAYDLKAFQTKPLGAGPYRVVKNSPSGILLERFQTNCHSFPKLPKVYVKVVREDFSKYLKLKNGEIDIILNNLDYRKVKQIMEDTSGIGFKVEEGISYQYIGLNFANKHLKKRKVRKAIAHSLDVPAIIEHKLSGMATVASGILTKSNWYYNDRIEPVKRDIGIAKKLLAEAGYYNGENNKPPLVLSLKTTTNKVVVENAMAIKSQLGEAGIVVKHQAFEWGTFYGDVKARNTEMYLLRWVGVTSPGHFNSVFHSEEVERNNRTNYKNKKMDYYLDRAKGTLDVNVQKKAYDKVQEIAASDFPYISLWHGKNVAVYRKNLQNVKLFANGGWETFLFIHKKGGDDKKNR